MSELDWMSRHVQRVVLWIRPNGGQHQSRRNAWCALADCDRRRVERLAAQPLAAIPAATTSG